MTQGLRAANTDWDSGVGFCTHCLCGARGDGLSGHRARAEGNAHRSSNGSNKEESKRSRGGKKPSEVQFENKETALSAHSNHPWLSSECVVAKFFGFSPWRPCLGVSALAARAGRAGRSEWQDEGCSAQRSAQSFRDQEKPPLLLQPQEHPEPARLPRVAPGRKQI